MGFTITDVVSSPDEVQGRPKRQITLSTKAQELLSDRQTAQLHMILQVRMILLLSFVSY